MCVYTYGPHHCCLVISMYYHTPSFSAVGVRTNCMKAGPCSSLARSISSRSPGNTIGQMIANTLQMFCVTGTLSDTMRQWAVGVLAMGYVGQQATREREPCRWSDHLMWLLSALQRGCTPVSNNSRWGERGGGGGGDFNLLIYRLASTSL